MILVKAHRPDFWRTPVHPSLLTLPAVFLADVLAAAAFAIDQNLATTVTVTLALVGGTIGAVMAVLKFIDSRIEEKLKTVKDQFDAQNKLLDRLLQSIENRNKRS